MICEGRYYVLMTTNESWCKRVESSGMATQINPGLADIIWLHQKEVALDLEYNKIAWSIFLLMTLWGQ